MVKYGLLTCLGRKATVRPFLVAALGSADAVALAPPPPLSLEEFLVVPPQAVAPSATAAVTATTTVARRVRVLDMVILSLPVRAPE